ncbi:hypothetical protein NADFUDRAFT_48213 [Nadsonia fulvescens var. elongata DSM 6958]|uniref:Rab-GAP TBC domain-containing protein n=1 Tax=Nadsonia fulvescens var. elongata DSM 6958 TaxID=857566 RepID=A0A1E3PD93_9ASCO|nr:hypothetical protein NADFUDRAFT_48213 [Nadsonia fulvescens var. elongata DSM 6958]
MTTAIDPSFYKSRLPLQTQSTDQGNHHDYLKFSPRSTHSDSIGNLNNMTDPKSILAKETPEELVDAASLDASLKNKSTSNSSSSLLTLKKEHMDIESVKPLSSLTSLINIAEALTTNGTNSELNSRDPSVNENSKFNANGSSYENINPVNSSMDMATATNTVRGPSSIPASPSLPSFQQLPSFSGRDSGFLTNSLSKLSIVSNADDQSNLPPILDSRNIPSQSPLSSPSSSSSSFSNNQNSHSTQHRFRHHHKPKISDSPQLVNLCMKFIQEENTAGLAKIARSRGLPPDLRQYAWPLLLASHPFVLNPSIDLEFPGQDYDLEEEVEIVPIRRIKGDISRYVKRLKSHHHRAKLAKLNKITDGRNSGLGGYNSDANSINLPGSKTPTIYHISHQQSAKSTPLSVSPSDSCGKGSHSTFSSNTPSSNPLLLNAFDNTAVDASLVNDFLEESLESQKFEIIEESIEAFLSKYGRVIPYESGMAWIAIALSDSINPIFELDISNSSAILNDYVQNINGEFNGNNLSRTASNSSSNNHSDTPIMKPVKAWPQPNSINFSKLFEQLMLILLHAPKPDANSPGGSINGPKGPCDSLITDRISFFLSAFRKLYPDLAEHFDEEDIFSNIGGDEWLLWWIKWKGAKVWSNTDRARIWDMYLGWRDDVNNTEVTPSTDDNYPFAATTLASEASSVSPVSPSAAALLDGLVDPFWNIDVHDTPGHNETPIPTLDPDTQHLFICLALFKAKKSTLLELDQSEIREYLGRIQLKNTNDIEAIVLEAGEIWRAWKWSEESEGE